MDVIKIFITEEVKQTVFGLFLLRNVLLAYTSVTIKCNGIESVVKNEIVEYIDKDRCEVIPNGVRLPANVQANDIRK